MLEIPEYAGKLVSLPVNRCHIQSYIMTIGRVRSWTAKSSKKMLFLELKKVLLPKKSALESAFFSAKKVFSYRKG